jgi:minor extracellular serine protease Vpr
VSAGLVVVAAAGNDGDIGVLPHTLSTIHTPGTAPSAITAGATVNAHLLYQAVHVLSSTQTLVAQRVNALFGDGPQGNPALPPLSASAPVIDVGTLGNNGLACTALPAGSLSGAVALIERGLCVYSDKINYAQQAGAVGVILYQSAGINSIYNTLGAQNTGIPTVMIGYNDGVNLKNMIDNPNSGVTVQFDPTFIPAPTASNTIWPASSRGPSIGSFTESPYQTFAVKPELVAPGAGIYTATQALDPNGEVYNASGYTGVTGTSYAVPMVAGAVALVKQSHPTWTPAQLKSAVVNTAAPGVTDTDGITAAGLNAVGAGLLNVANAMNVAATISPATIAFGAITTATLPITLSVTNVTAASATFSFAVQPANAASSSVTVSPATLTLAAGTGGNVTVKAPATVPAAGSYEGFIVVTGPAASPALRVPYQFLVGSGVPADIFPAADGQFLGAVGDSGNSAWLIAFRLIDAYGVPVAGPAQFSAVSGGGSIEPKPDTQTYRYGLAGALVDLSLQPGPQIFTGIAANLTVEFAGYARSVPAIAANGVMDAASFHTDYGLAPGSYITIKGTSLSDTTQVYSTPYLPVSLSTVSVSFDGSGGLSLPGHLHFVSPGQINVQVPWEFQGQSSVAMKVTVAGNTSDLQGNVYTVPLANYAPAFFLNSGAVADALDNNTGALITTANPAAAGEILQLYANGLGPVTNPPASGDPALASPLSLTSTPVTVTIGGQQATVYGGSAFLAPGFVGLYQIDIQVPSGLNPGPQPIAISVGGVTSPSTANGSTVILPVK